jgi:hypothetical protein
LAERLLGKKEEVGSILDLGLVAGKTDSLHGPGNRGARSRQAWIKPPRPGSSRRSRSTAPGAVREERIRGSRTLHLILFAAVAQRQSPCFPSRPRGFDYLQPLVVNKNNKKRNPSDHKATEEDGEVFPDPWMWEDEDEEKAQTEWQQGTAPDLTPREDDDGS